MTRRMILMLLVAGVIFGGIFGYKAVGNYYMNQFFDNMPQPAATITATEVVEDTWLPTTEAVGSFRPVDGAELAAEVSGIVSLIHFDNGSGVERGQRLVSLTTDADEAELERLEAAERLARLELARVQRLFEQGSTSRADLERSESEVAQAAAMVRTQQARIRQKTIRAPFDGIAGIRRVNVGQFVSAGDPVVAVESLAPIYLGFSLPEHRLADVRVGQTVTATVPAFPGIEFEGEVTAIEPRIRESTRTVEIQATFANDTLSLRPGMFGRARLGTGISETVRVVPQTAIRFSTYGNSVFVVDEDAEGQLRVTQRFIRTGATRGDMITVVEGLDIGDRVATSGLLKLRNGAPVTLSDNAAYQPSAETDPRPVNR